MRRGLRIHGTRGSEEVRSAFIRYAKWLRRKYDFPIRVAVYLSPRALLTTMDGGKAVASFFAPFSRTVEPYIRVATGDYLAVKLEHGRYSALASFLASLSHEGVHYQRWIRTGGTSERCVTAKAFRMVNRYLATVDEP